MDTTPTVMPPPTGYTTQLERPHQRSTKETYGIYVSLNLVSLALMVARIYVWKRTKERTRRTEVAAFAVSYCTSTVAQALLLATVSARLSGIHAWDLPLAKYNLFTKLFHTAFFFYVACTASARLAVCMMNYTVFSLPNCRRCIKTCIAMTAFTAMLSGAGGLLACDPTYPKDAACRPVIAALKSNRMIIHVIILGMGCFVDLVIHLFPIIWIWNLQNSTKDKIELGFRFGIGVATIFAPCCLAYTLVLARDSLDQTWLLHAAIPWIIADANLTTIRYWILAKPLWFRYLCEKIEQATLGQCEDNNKGVHALHTYQSQVTGETQPYQRQHEDSVERLISVPGVLHLNQ